MIKEIEDLTLEDIAQLKENLTLKITRDDGGDFSDDTAREVLQVFLDSVKQREEELKWRMRYV